jgi:hypothetical protein
MPCRGRSESISVSPNSNLNCVNAGTTAGYVPNVILFLRNGSEQIPSVFLFYEMASNGIPTYSDRFVP